MPETKIKNDRVVVALSGGVDSSVAAYLLQQQGYEVIGISLKVWDEKEGASPRAKTCCSYNDIQDARAVCDKLEIPFFAFNFKQEFQQRVIEPFVKEYFAGRTPNPCILCNQFVKFDLLLQEALKLGARYLATGHHARIIVDAEGGAHLMKGCDSKKDQSYVLYQLNQQDLQKILLPIGNYSKEEIRQIALDHHIPTAAKPESQDICFIPNRDHAAFIEKNYPHYQPAPGLFVDSNGKTLGTHRGIHAYTVGQRRGLGIGVGERLYVSRIDTTNNEVELKNIRELDFGGLVARGIHWIQDPTQIDPEDIQVKIRYQKDEIPAWLLSKPCDQKMILRFKIKGPAVSPGQAAVLYRGDEVLGGGTIEGSL